MPDSAETLRHVRAQELTLTLRALQRRLNQTVDELCALVAGQVGEVVALQAEAAHWEPALLTLPLPVPVWPQPASGLALGPGSSFYVGEHHGMLQLVQAPRSQDHMARYTCNLNFADFDGGWMSLAFDLRSLLKSASSGRMRLVVLGDCACTPAQSLQVKCNWRQDGAEPKSRQLAPDATGALQLSLDLGWIDPAQLKTMDLHLIFTVAGRGSISLHSLQAALVVDTDTDTGGGASDVFEEAP